jgi:hypothetical protein
MCTVQQSLWESEVVCPQYGGDCCRGVSCHTLVSAILVLYYACLYVYFVNGIFNGPRTGYIISIEYSGTGLVSTWLMHTPG